MGNSSAGRRYSEIFSLRRACGILVIERTGGGLGRRAGKNLPRSDELPMSVQFSVLGPVRAWRGPAELTIGPGQQRAILVLLLVRANQLVPVDDIMELLWEESPRRGGRRRSGQRPAAADTCATET